MNPAPCTTPLLHRSHRPSGQIEIILTLILFHPFCCSSTTSNILSINIKCHRAPETFSWLCSSAFSSPLWDRLQVSQRKVQQTGRGCSRTFWWIILLVNDGLTPFGSVLKKYHCSSIPTLGQCTNQGYRATRAVKNIFPYMVEKSKTNMKDKRQRIKQGKAHLPHMSLRRWAGNVPWRSTTSLPYLSCNFRLYNNICFMQGKIQYLALIQINPSFYPSEMNLNPPDIGVKLSVKRLHLVIHGHHLALKVSCLISGAGVEIQIKIEPSNLPRHWSPKSEKPFSLAILFFRVTYRRYRGLTLWSKIIQHF